MVELFSAIADFITMIVDGITNFISIVGNSISFVSQFFVFLPTPLVVMLGGALTVMIAIAIIKLI